jgi:hypothetical protein
MPRQLLEAPSQPMIGNGGQSVITSQFQPSKESSKHESYLEVLCDFTNKSLEG